MDDFWEISLDFRFRSIFFSSPLFLPAISRRQIPGDNGGIISYSVKNVYDVVVIKAWHFVETCLMFSFVFFAINASPELNSMMRLSVVAD